MLVTPALQDRISMEFPVLLNALKGHILSIQIENVYIVLTFVLLALHIPTVSHVIPKQFF